MNLYQFVSPLRALATFWRRLTEPSATVQQPDQRRQSQLLASLLVALAVLTVLVVALVQFFGLASPTPDDGLIVLGAGFIAFLLIPYTLSRRGKYELAALLTVAALSLGLFVAAASGEFADIHFLYNLLLGVLIASVFLTIPATLAVVAAQVAGMLVFAALAPPAFAPYVVYGPLSSLLVGSILIWLFTHHRRRLEADRQAQLARSEERYRIIAELISDYAYSYHIEPDGTFVREWVTEESFLRVTGYTWQEMFPREQLALFHPDEHARHAEEENRLRRGEAVSGDYRIVTKAGDMRWVQITRRAVQDEQGMRILCIAKDVTEQKQSEAALRDSEEKNRILVQLAREGIFVETPEGEILDCNPAGCEMFGYTRDEIIGLHVRDVAPAEYAPLLPQVITEAHITGGEYWERVYKRKDGTLFPSEVNTQFFTVGGEKRLIVFVRDITERKQAEEALRESEARFRTFVDHAADAFFLLDEQGIILDVNHQACNSLGYRREELIGRSVQDFDPDVAPAFLQELRARLDAGETVVFDTRHRRKDGSAFPVEVRTRPLRAGNRRFGVSLVRDITERKQAEAALRASEERYRLLSELLSDYAYAYRVEPDGIFVLEWITDEAFRRVTGYTWSEVDAMEPFALFHPDERPYLPQQEELLRRGQPVSGTYRIMTKGGETRWLYISRYPVWDERDKRVARLLCTAKDVTERKQAEEQELKLALERERLMLVSRFVSAVSHDFRTALANIETSRYLAERAVSDAERDKVQPRLEIIRRAVSHLTEQLGNLHTISFLSEPNPETCNLNSLVEALIAEQRARAQEKAIQVSFVPDFSLPLLRADKEELRRALRHLLANALTHTPENGAVMVRTFKDGGSVSVEVADSGPGIAAEHLGYVFDPFYRGDSARSIDSGGVGLGLSIVKMVVEAHGGSVGVRSDSAQGSVFTMTLPVNSAVAERG